MSEDYKNEVSRDDAGVNRNENAEALQSETHAAAELPDDTSLNADTYMVGKKNKNKTVKVIVQAALLVGIAVFLVMYFIFPQKYEPYDSSAVTGVDNGFIAISYFGVDKFESMANTYIYEKRLDEHLGALYDQGFVTITQQDIIDYYENGKLLPEKALFLFFEDGRKDTANFAHNLLAKYNFKATVQTYADKFEMNDSKFLATRNLRVLERTTFWEMGSNGYRLHYINIYDRYRNFYDQLDSNEFVLINQYLDRDYNHYLMDFIRDEDRIPVETLEEMKARIKSDYDSMELVYLRELGYVPRMYTLMHSNSGMYASDEYVSIENFVNMTRIFEMNFNREGYSVNKSGDSIIYDLTRMQPQANWYVNHLLMRIWDDTDMDIRFVIGDEEEAAKWEQLKGVTEYRDNTIVLTTDPDTYGRIALKDFDQEDLELSVYLNGNIGGNQGVGLRATEDLSSALYISIESNVLFVREIRGGAKLALFELDLFEFDGGSTKSVEEDEKEGLIAKENAILLNDDDYFRLQEAQENLTEWQAMEVTTLADGGEGFVPAIDLTDKGTRKLDVTLDGAMLSVKIDGKVAVENLAVSVARGGGVYLESEVLGHDNYSQRNLFDDVYDGVFKDLQLRQLSSEAENNAPQVYYEYRLNFFGRVAEFFVKLFENIAIFFIRTF